MSIKISTGPAASNIYKIMDNDVVISHLLLDWSFKAIDFKYMNNKWMTLNNDNIKLLNKEEINEIKELSIFAINNVESYPEKSDETLKTLKNLIYNMS